MFSLRRLTWLVFLFSVLLLATVIFLGVWQYTLSNRYKLVIAENEKTVFRFLTLRESVTDALIMKDWQKLGSVIPELEKMNSALGRFQENSRISPEIRLSLMSKIDLAGIAIRLRRFAAGGGTGEELRIVQDDMRYISDQLLKYDRVIVGQAHAMVINLQMIIIGSMGIIISIVSFSMVLIYRNSIVPQFDLTKKLQQDVLLPETLVPPPGASRETVELTRTVQALASEVLSGSECRATSLDHAIVAETVNETVNQINGIINYAQLLADLNERELLNQHKELLGKIIETGSSIALSWKNLNRREQ